MNLRQTITVASTAIALAALSQTAFAQTTTPAAPAAPTDPAMSNPAPAGANPMRARRQAGNRQPANILAAVRTLDLTDDQKTKLKALVEKLTTDVEAMLTTEQKDQLKAAMQNTRGANGNQGGGQMNLMAALDSLNLTDDQKAKIEPITKDTQEQIAKVRADNSLQGRDRQTKMQSIVTDMKAKIRPLLTPDQQTKFDALPMNLRGNRRGANANGVTAGAANPNF